VSPLHITLLAIVAANAANAILINVGTPGGFPLVLATIAYVAYWASSVPWHYANTAGRRDGKWSNMVTLGSSMALGALGVPYYATVLLVLSAYQHFVNDMPFLGTYNDYLAIMPLHAAATYLTVMPSLVYATHRMVARKQELQS
jgi:hypothetical protein